MTVARLSTSTKCGNVCAGCLGKTPCWHPYRNVKFYQAQFQLASPVHKKSIENGVSDSCKCFKIVSPLNKNFENKSGWAGPHSSSKFSKFQLDSKYSTVKQSTWSLLLKFLGQRSLVSKTFPLKKNWVLTNFGYKKLWVTDLEKLTMKKQFGSKNILDPKNFILDLTWHNLTWSVLTWFDLIQIGLTCLIN